MSQNKIIRLVDDNKYPFNKVDALIALLKQLKKYSHHYYNGELYIRFEKTYLVYPNEYLISDIKRLLQNKWNTTAEKYILPELRTRVKTKIETDNEPWNIYLSNGHFDTIKNRFVSIDKYEKNRFIIPVSPVPRDPDGTCPNFDKWLEELFEGDPDAKKKILLMEEVLATVLLPNNFEKAFILYGETFNGKSTFCNVAKFMVTESSDVEMRDFQNKNAILPFSSSVVNISTEVNLTGQKEFMNFKKVVSQEELQVEAKYKDTYTIKPRLTLIGSTNQYPHVLYRNKDLRRRTILVTFPNNFEHVKDDTLEATFKKERAGILNRAIKGAIRLRANNGKYSFNEFETYPSFDPNAVFRLNQFITKRMNKTKWLFADFYQEYLEFCTNYRLQHINDKSINKALGSCNSKYRVMALTGNKKYLVDTELYVPE